MTRWISAVLIFFMTSGILQANDVVPMVERQKGNKLARSTPNIYKLTTKSGVAYRLQTAIGYITTIDLPEEARKVFVGDGELFKVEVYGAQVIIKPATDYLDARTNLTIYTLSSRLCFDVSVGSPDTADFVLDFRLPSDEAMVQNEFKAKIEEKKEDLEKVYQEKEKKQTEIVKKLALGKFEEEIKKGTSTKELKMSEKGNGIQINLLSLTEIGNRSYLRFSILNYSDRDLELERVIAGGQTVRRSGFNLQKEGFVPVELSVNLENIIPKNSYKYGLLSFEKVYLKKDEQFVMRIYEKGNNQPLEISNIPVEAKP